MLQEREKIDEAIKKSEGKPIGASEKFLHANIYISASYNNTLITVCNEHGDTLTWASAGSVGFRGAKKSTPFAASKVAETITERAKKLGISQASIFIKGIGSGRESAIRAFGHRGVNIVSIKDVTPVPHNGCRPPKVRRV